eukprot:TRINITY_DN3993_c0_g1_i1.p1 TRINITY_DN3993_c0_g1~~TRINITY_DN3993_c0_g1_i1.p1  ORF type:complete len:265 (-),score=38.27 TRINITY_DN3993_c0_g1_i1:108-902(-)
MRMGPEERQAASALQTATVSWLADTKQFLNTFAFRHLTCTETSPLNYCLRRRSQKACNTKNYPVCFPLRCYFNPGTPCVPKLQDPKDCMKSKTSCYETQTTRECGVCNPNKQRLSCPIACHGLPLISLDEVVRTIDSHLLQFKGELTSVLMMNRDTATNKNFFKKRQEEGEKTWASIVASDSDNERLYDSDVCSARYPDQKAIDCYDCDTRANPQDQICHVSLISPSGPPQPFCCFCMFFPSFGHTPRSWRAFSKKIVNVCTWY